ncbi:Sugar phosphate permease [Desulfuromusa kysingii]|uniref:Sugar phosphate permease n=1 Tax=Desulfuromusa kysingii TaxID=37625 RepID=A0A1H3WC07_9BACT|nr:Sugar phosphate permease [Desulfuromusa kysingii]
MKKLPFHYGWLIVFTGTLTLFSCLGLARFAFGMLLPSMGAGLELAYDQMGYLGTGNFSGYLFAVAITPTVLNKLRPRTTISVGLFLVATTLAGMSQANFFWQLLLLYVLTGVGSGLANISTMVLIAHWFRREKRGLAAGLMVFGNGLGIIFSGLMVPLLNQNYAHNGWRVSWLLLAGITFSISLLAAFLVRNEPESLGLDPVGSKTPFSGEELRYSGSTKSSRVLISLGLLYMAFGATYMVYGTFVVTSMVEEYGFSEVVAGRFWSWVGFFSLFSGVVFGTLSDRLGRKSGLIIVFAVQTLAYLLAGSGLGAAALLLSVFLYGIAVWAVPAIMTAAVGDYLGVTKAAAGFSFITFFFAAGQTIGPAIAGMLAEHSGSFSPAFLLSALITGVAILFALSLPQPAES